MKKILEEHTKAIKKIDIEYLTNYLFELKKYEEKDNDKTPDSNRAYYAGFQKAIELLTKINTK